MEKQADEGTASAVKRDPIGKMISYIYRIHQRNLAPRLKEIGLGSGGHHSYLLNVLYSPGVNQDQLTARLGFDKATTTRCVTQLEEEGYLVRRTDPQDRRSYLLYPTERAAAFEPVLRGLLDEANRQLTANLSESEREQLHGLLQKLYGSLTDA